MVSCGECGKVRDTNPDTDNCAACDAAIVAAYPFLRLPFGVFERAQKGAWNPYFLASLKGDQSHD